jgi:hypothetical protein
VMSVRNSHDQPAPLEESPQETGRTTTIGRQKLIAEIRKQGNPNNANAPPIVVGVREFFTGNHDIGSMGANLVPTPPIERFHAVLRQIEDREDVQAVLIQIAEVEWNTPGIWPYSDNIYVLSSASRGSVRQWLSELRPDEVYEGYPFGKPPAAPDVKPGMKVYGAWWD